MQLYARSEEGHVVAAAHALKQRDYFCLECQGPVRLRAGSHRQRHYYHLQLSSACRLSTKSMEHLQTQCYIQRMIGSEAARLEWPFPAIGRIADVAWMDQKLIFEVQCSPITAEEVAARNRDYAKEGYSVIWILHETRFNQWRVTAAEAFLRTRSYYFTNINAEGEGGIYDQFDHLEQGVRKHRLPALAVQISAPQSLPNDLVPPLDRIEQRLERSRLYFRGDLTDVAVFDQNHAYLVQAMQIEEASLQVREPEKTPWWSHIYRWYFILFRLFLEKSSS